MSRLSYRKYARQTVVVNTKTGKAFRGVFFGARGPLLVLRQATLLEPGHAVAVDGEVLVERSNIDFLQVVPSAHPSV